jgi:hypothetical protein
LPLDPPSGSFAAAAGEVVGFNEYGSTTPDCLIQPLSNNKNPQRKSVAIGLGISFSEKSSSDE